jgi:hypothetical protein
MHADALRMIGENDELPVHLALITVAMEACWNAGQAQPDTDNEQTMQVLCFRLFNHMAASLRLAFAGYFQASLLVQRDLYETGWLVAYLLAHPDNIPAWRDGDAGTRNRDFAPGKVRKALSEFDGVPKERRDAHYWNLCDYAAHPNAKGFVLLCPPGDSGPQCGPFMTPEALRYSLEELARACSVAATSSCGLGVNSTTTAQLLRKLFIATSEWNAQFMGVPCTSERLGEINELFGTV